MNIANKAVESVEKLLNKKYPKAKIERVDSGKEGKQHKGYDILVTKRGDEKIKIEVKGTEMGKKKLESRMRLRQDLK